MEPSRQRLTPSPLCISSPRARSSPLLRTGRSTPKVGAPAVPMKLLQRVLSRDSFSKGPFLGKECDAAAAASPPRLPLRPVPAPPPLDSPASFGSDDDELSPACSRFSNYKRQRVSSRLGDLLSPLARAAFGRTASPGGSAFRPPPIRTMTSLEPPPIYTDVSAAAAADAAADAAAAAHPIAPPPTPRQHGGGFRMFGGCGAPMRQPRLGVPAMSLVAPGLYVGDETAAASAASLVQGGVTHVLNCTSKPNVALEAPGASIGYLRLDLMDNMSDLPRMQSTLRLGVDFIRLAHQQGGVVLVHCHRGISRSCTLAMAYLIEALQQPAEAVFESVRAARRIVDPNLCYWMAIQEWERAVLPAHLRRPRSRALATPSPRPVASPRPLSRAG